MQSLEFYNKEFNTDIILNYDNNECTYEYYKQKVSELNKRLKNIVIHIDNLDQSNVSSLMAFLQDLIEKDLITQTLIVCNVLTGIIPSYSTKKDNTLILRTKTHEYESINTKILYYKNNN